MFFKKEGKGTPKDKGTPYLESDLHRRVQASLQKTNDRNQERAKQRKQKEESIPYEDDIVEAQKNFSLQIALRDDSNISTQVNGHRKGKHKYPDSVLAVYDLAVALHEYQGELSAKNNVARLRMAEELTKQLTIFLQKLSPSTIMGIETGDLNFDAKNGTHTAARDFFQNECTKIMTTYYKDLASETSLWNEIKNLFNIVCKLIGLKPNGCLVDSTLDSSALIKSQSVNEKFWAVKQTEQIKIVDEEDVDTELKGPGL